MQDLVFIKELFAVIASVTAILAMLAALALWVIKKAFQNGEMYQLFKSLVQEVGSIKEIMNNKFLDNEAKHDKHTQQFQQHDKRITILEVKSDGKSAEEYSQ